MKNPRSSALLLLLFGLMGLCIAAYKPVVIVHGILDGPEDFNQMSRFITKAHERTTVKVINLYNDMDSFAPIWEQVDNFRKVIREEMRAAPDGIHLLCFSQGGLICRAILATTPDHNVHTFISLAAPQAGQYGETDYLKSIFPELMKETIFQACCNNGRQVSICGYWKDPHHLPSYLEFNNFLAKLDGEKPHHELGAWRLNFLRIKKLVLIGGPDDGVITPWQSSQFAFYDINEKVIGMRNRNVYTKNVFGLRTLEKRGDLVSCVLPGVRHIHWHRNDTVFSTCIEKWLI